MGEMDHNEVRDLLADAAIEPDGLERLMAGDTPTAALVAGHLAGCPDCADELERLHRTIGIIRPTVRAVPPPELRERTLAYVAAVGRPRGPAAPIAAGESVGRALTPAATSRPSSGARRLAVLAGLAAALVLAVTGTALLVNGSRDALIRTQAGEIEALGEVARWTARVDGEPDVQRIRLASTTGGQTTGTLVFSPSSTELVVMAEDLVPPPAGHEYRCWVDVGGRRAGVGKMFFGGGLAYWVGKVPEVAGLGTDARFGVSLVNLAAPDQPGEPVLVSAG
jgi:Anti-sigma-K factor rskA